MLWTSATIVAGLVAQVASYNLTILHTNDVHAHIDDYEENDLLIGSVARRKTVVDRVRAEKDNVLLLDAGDQFSGTLWFYVYEGQAAAHFMNMLEYDAEAFGNHEFDLGSPVLAEFLDTANHPLVACNIDASGDPDLAGKFVPYTIVEKSGRKIAIIGITTPDTVFLASPSAETIFSDPLVKVPEAIAQVKEEDPTVNIFIVLGHYGYDNDIALAQAVPEIDIVVGGHSHSFLYGPPDSEGATEDPLGPYPTVVEHADGTQSLVVQAYQYAKYMGDIDLVFDDAGQITGYSNHPIMITANATGEFEAIPADPTVQAEVELWGHNVTALTLEEISQTAVFLMGDRTVCRKQECNLGNLIADSYVYRIMNMIKNNEKVALAGLMNGGGIRSDIEVGTIAYGDALNVLPFGNEIISVDMPGSALLEALEHGVSMVEEGEGRFPQLSGIRHKFDLSKPVGSRIVDAEILCQTQAQCSDNDGRPHYVDINVNENYTVVTLSYLAGGGDGYEMFAPHPTVNYNFVDADIFIEYIKMQGLVYPAEEGRIVQIVNGTALNSNWVSTGEEGVESNGVSAAAASNATNTEVEAAELSSAAPASEASTAECEASSSGLDTVWVVVIALLCAVVGAGAGFGTAKMMGSSHKEYDTSESRTNL
ncbi:hypothetical protein SARC_10046 [Sphaeroforma arctica JP610]|uniref:apyrase n=1 Tax=Sphaeroforma arctica JP610 TaxID=667725 RepID=A0A0L0FL54_9EUKA|nr:hypothetical protein SARC_10046 [Sphaeroforma arctica JP610]KNC77495.1 hypothetical protein SARC_10046 [Sphaeroforma arctica JP610]|eukprot:XP_014151397.1 hypothetical protein SARC_10046 [Sphaeroforma arctica JP610]